MEKRFVVVFVALVAIGFILVGCGSKGGGGDNPVAAVVPETTVTVRGQIEGEGDLTGVGVFLVKTESNLAVTPGSTQASLRGSADGQIYTTATNASGTFVFSEVRLGVYNLIAQNGRYQGAILRNLNIGAEVQVTEGLKLRLTPTGQISGTVTVPAGFNVSGVTAFVKGTSYAAFTGDRGEYLIFGVPVGTWTVAFFAPGLMQSSVQGVGVAIGETTAIPPVNLTKDQAFVIQGPAGPQGPAGTNGVSITWKGALPQAPANPQLNWAYYNVAQGKAFLYDGANWTLMAKDGITGIQGPAGPQGPTGADGISIVWKGSLSSAPTGAQVNWAYYDSTQGKAFIYVGGAWQILVKDGATGLQGPAGPAGADGRNGLSIVWQGSYADEAALVAAKGPKQVNWAYLNTTDKQSYLWDGTNWVTFVPTGDTESPTISNVFWEPRNGTAVRIFWETNEDAMGKVEFGTGASYGTLSDPEPSFNSFHQIDLTNLSPNTEYHFRTRAKDVSNNESISDDQTFSLSSPVLSNLLTSGNRGTIGITFDLAAMVNCSAKVFYSLDGGTTWSPTTHLSLNSSFIPAGVGRTITWDSHLDFGSLQSNVKVKVVANDGAIDSPAVETPVFAVNNRSEVTNVTTAAKAAGPVTITYSLAASINSRIQVLYSVDGGVSFTETTNLSGNTIDLPAGEALTVVWNSHLDVTGGPTNAIVRVVANEGTTDGVAGDSASFSLYNHGAKWTQATSAAGFSERTQHASVVFNNKMWVIGGSSGGDRNDVWSSPDGVTWTQETAAAGFSPRRCHSCVVFNNKIWVIGGYSNNFFTGDVWSSPDGVTWTLETAATGFSLRARHSSVVFNNKMWVIGGDVGNTNRNDVWSSSDGITWTLETAAAGFSWRNGHSSVVFDNRIWVIGGQSANGMNDVWSSPDGVTWTEETASAQFPPLSGHSTIIFDNRMWVFSGNSSGRVWSSADGITWTTTGNTEFGYRSGSTSIAFNGKMWLIAGYGGSSYSYCHDVWWSD